ncbi:MAG TPA: dihydrofolate reductase family protein [Solirubrobacteraceae bacterium]|jgi:riboflavin-specific deaminase-like protein|nr:dihydrofolate reductase family protein [Solirubrobacteraceae bacterium]
MTSPERLRFLIGGRGSPTALEAVAGLDLAGQAPPGRPRVALNMVSTADGKAAIAGRTASIGNRADRELFHALRTSVDAVMVGAGTVRTERYGRLVRDRALREVRVAAGRAPEPWAIVVSASLDLAPDLPLLAEPEAKVVVMTTSDAELQGVAAQVGYLRCEQAGGLDVGELLGRARRELGIASVLCEGGPQLNSTLLAAGLIDELFLCLAPKLIGGRDLLTIVAGEPQENALDLELRWLLEADGHLFARYTRPD